MTHKTNEEFKLDGSGGLFWAITQNGQEVARITGPMSYGIAVAAVERLRQGKFFVDGWIQKGLDYQR